MRRYRVHLSPSDEDSSFRRRGLLGRLKKAKEPAAPWEVETEPAIADPPPRTRGGASSSRLGRITTGSLRAVDVSGGVGRLRSKARMPSVDVEGAPPGPDLSQHSPDDTDDPWAASAGGKGYDAEATLPDLDSSLSADDLPSVVINPDVPPPPAPVPPDPLPAGGFPSPELPAAGGPGAGFDSDSFWGDAVDLGAAAGDDGFLGGGGEFDMDVGFTHESVADASVASFGDDSLSTGGDPFAVDGDPAPLFGGMPLDDLGLASDAGLPDLGLTGGEPAPASAPPEPSFEAPEAFAQSHSAHDMSYPDIPSISADDALSRGSELMEQGSPEDALALFEMGLRIEPDHGVLKQWQIYAEKQVLADILPGAEGRVLRPTSAAPPSFADPRDTRLAASLTAPKRFEELRAEHDGMSIREFAGRVNAMLSMGVFAWYD